jgi:hypothetical protein
MAKHTLRSMSERRWYSRPVILPKNRDARPIEGTSWIVSQGR